MGIHLIGLSKSFLKNTKMAGFRWFSSVLDPSAFGESSLSIEKINPLMLTAAKTVSHNFDEILRGKSIVKKYFMERCKLQHYQ